MQRACDFWTLVLVCLVAASASCSTSEAPAESESADSQTSEVAVEDTSASADAVVDCTDDLDCEDDNTCTADLCESGACTNSVLSAEPCDDGNPCTQDTACRSNGQCGGGVNVDCDDDDPCTVDGCDTAGCTHEPAEDGYVCNDRDPCTENDLCAGGACIGQPLECDAHGPCQLPAGCQDGECITQAALDGTPCQFEDKCIIEAACVSGACTGGHPKDCDDGNPCTVRTCNPSKGTCQTGTSTLDGQTCEDGNPCTESEACLGGVCKGTPVSCDDDNECTSDSCDPIAGACVNKPAIDNKPCTDNDLCTTSDKCFAGACVGGDEQDCDDGNACTTDGCDPSTGLCKYVNNTALCDDGDLCTVGDSCQQGLCLPGSPKECSDENSCTEDKCDPATGVCGIPTNEAGDCDDGNACTVGETCQSGECTKADDLSCDDDVACTVDSCDPAAGCSNVPDDHVCDDSVECSLDVCDLELGCQHTPPAEDCCVTAADCDDGEGCTVDVCAAGQCTHDLVTCPGDDGNPCSDDVCDPTDGSCGVPVADGTAVPDEDLCDGVETCGAGAVLEGTPVVCANDGNPCTEDVCNPEDGSCGVPVEDGTEAPDEDLCDGTETCLAGAVVAGTGVVCEEDDGNPCTADECNPDNGTCGISIADGTEVPDDDLCDGTETCLAGAIAEGTPILCPDDGNPCTADVCDPADGSCGVFVDDGTELADLDLCDGTEVCVGGSLAPGVPLVCSNDGNPCIIIACDPLLGCTNKPEPNGTDCDDGDPNTGFDTCDSGSCVGMAPPPQAFIADTEQVRCFNATEELADCPEDGQVFAGQDGSYLRPPHSFVAVDESVALDLITGLFWQRGASELIQWGVPSGSASYWDAIQYCESLTFGGLAWRLPTPHEAQSLLTYESFACLDEVFEAPSGLYATVNNGINEWKCIGLSLSSGDKRVKCVAGEPLLLHQFEDLGDGTAFDSATSLQWQVDDGSGQIKWEDALAYCESLILAGKDDWHLPDVSELTRACTSEPLFPGEWTTYWTSTTRPNGAGTAYACVSGGVQNGLCGQSEEKDGHFLNARCVRACGCTDSDCCEACTPLADGTACSDGDGSTDAEYCAAGICTPAMSGADCSGIQDGTLCNDADPCTEEDTCTDGSCVGEPIANCTDPVSCSTGLSCGAVCCPSVTGYDIYCNSQDHCEYQNLDTAGWKQWDVWIWVPPGSFEMGPGQSEEAVAGPYELPQHTITLDYGFLMARYEATVAAYEACESDGGCETPGAPTKDWGGRGLNRSTNGRTEHPQNSISWFEAHAFCQWVAPTGRLPSEAEWEYAANGRGEHLLYPWGDQPQPTCDSDLAVFNDAGGEAGYGCGEGGTSPVHANFSGLSAIGMQNSAGNVWEWVQDCLHYSYVGAPLDGSAWVDDACVEAGLDGRVLRGGGYHSPASDVRLSTRNERVVGFRDSAYGTRCAMEFPCGVAETLEQDGSCSPNAEAACHEQPDDTACDDEDPCTNSDACQAGLCSGTPLECTGNDVCEEGECVCGTLGVSCPDGFICTETGTCENLTTDEVYVPEGPFWMGCNDALDSNCDADEKPQHEVIVPAFAIDRTETTVAAYAACVDAGVCDPPAMTHADGDYYNYGAAGREDHPVNGTTRALSESYCESEPGRRLCTEAEWEKAARGGCEFAVDDCKTEMRTYPWGEASPTCDLVVMNNGTDGCGLQSTWPVGSKLSGASPYGALDMAGNVSEWVKDWYHSSYAEAPPDGSAWLDPVSTSGVERLGAFVHGPTYLRITGRWAGNPAGSPHDRGFRCCRSVSPDEITACTDQPDGELCDDGIAGTDAAFCSDGVCIPAASGADCTGIEDGTVCDDGDACTEGDVCSGGACVGATLPTCCPVDGGSLLRDGAFASGFGCWTSVGLPEPQTVFSEDSIESATAAPSIRIDNPASQVPGEVRLEQGSIEVEANRVYELRFWAKAAELGVVKVVMTDGVGSGPAIGLSEELLVGSTWDRHVARFAAPISMSSGTLAFHLGGYVGTVWIDDVVLAPLGQLGSSSCTADGDCDDGDPCTKGVCYPGTGCTVVAASGSCDDGNDCTEEDICWHSECVGGSCSPDCGGCGDGFDCIEGICISEPVACATVEDCIPSDANCVDAQCVAGECMESTREDTCAADSCGTNICGVWCGNCAPGNLCVDGVCEVLPTSCAGLDDGWPCDDGDPLTDADVCEAGACLPAISHQDCTGHLDGVACNDGDVCTLDDRCQSGACIGTTAAACSDDIALQNHVVVVDPAVAASVDSGTCGEMRFPLVGGQPPFAAAAGETIVSGHDGGFLCNVTDAYIEAGAWVVESVEGSLDDVVAAGTLDFSVPIEISDDPAPSGGQDGEPTGGNDLSASLTLTEQTLWSFGAFSIVLKPGYFEFNPDVDVRATYRPFGGVELTATVGGTLRVEASIEATIETGHSGFKPIFQKAYPFYFQLGPLPVAGTVDVKVGPAWSFSVGSELSSTIGWQTERSATVGASYAGGQWSKIKTVSPAASTVIGPTLDKAVSANASIELRALFTLRLYQAAAVDLTVGPRIQAQINGHPNWSYDWSIDRCFAAAFGGDVTIFGKELAEYEVSLIDECAAIWAGSGCLDECAVPSQTCASSSALVICGDLDDGDDCLDWGQVSCETGNECANDQCVAACTPASYTACLNGDVWSFDSCGNPEAETIGCVCGCQQGSCVAPCCTSQAYRSCHQGALWWFDSCGNAETFDQSCDCGCTGSTCDSCPSCSPGSTCCTSGGDYVSSGSSGNNCTAECKQCNGAGTCVNKSNGSSCSGGECSGGSCVAVCASNFCQTNQYGSGSYCIFDELLTCALTSGCYYVKTQVQCTYGCSSGQCNDPPSPAQVIVDNSDSGFTYSPSGPYWWQASDHDTFDTNGYGEHIRYTFGEGAAGGSYVGTWRTTEALYGTYRIYAYRAVPDAFDPNPVGYPDSWTTCTDVKYYVEHDGSPSGGLVARTQSGTGWLDLGTFQFTNRVGEVRLSDQASPEWCAVLFDAIRWQKQ